MIPAIQAESRYISIGVSNEVTESLAFWDSGLLWDNGTTLWDMTETILGNPSGTVSLIPVSVQVTV